MKPRGMGRLLPLLPLLVSCATAAPPGSPTVPGGGGYYPPAPPPPRETPVAPAALLRFGPRQLEFGIIEIGDFVEREVLLANEGDAAAEILSLAVTGPGFGVSRDGCSGRRLAPGRSCELRVRFAPRDPGPAAGTLVALAGAPVRRVEQPLRGEGLGRHAVPEISVQPAAPDFGRVETGAAAFLKVSVGNLGGRQVRLREASVIGPGFDVAQDGCAERVLEPRRECSIRLRFVPLRPGRVTGALRVRTEDPHVPVYTVALDGEGMAPAVPGIRLGARTLDFGSVSVGEARSARLSVDSVGGRELHVRTVRLQGRGFAVAEDGCSGRAVEPGSGCAVSVRFAPSVPGEAQGKLEIASDDPGERVAGVALFGVAKERQACPVQRLQLSWKDGADPGPLVVSGVLPRGGCLTYELRVRRLGSLQVCLPPGYALEAPGFELVEGAGCRIGDDSAAENRRYVRRGIEAETVLALTLSRRDDARREFKASILFRSPRGVGSGGVQSDEAD